MNKIINGVANDFEFDGIETFNRWQDPTINELQKQLDKYKLILKALHKHFTEHEEYENNEFLRQLENCTENDMIWLKRTAGDDEE